MIRNQKCIGSYDFWHVTMWSLPEPRLTRRIVVDWEHKFSHISSRQICRNHQLRDIISRNSMFLYRSVRFNTLLAETMRFYIEACRSGKLKWRIDAFSEKQVRRKLLRLANRFHRELWRQMKSLKCVMFRTVMRKCKFLQII